MIYHYTSVFPAIGELICCALLEDMYVQGPSVDLLFFIGLNIFPSLSQLCSQCTRSKTLHVVDLFCWAADGLAIGGAVAILWVCHWLPHRIFAQGPVHSLYGIALSLPPT
jgi:hypothetical protein